MKTLPNRITQDTYRALVGGAANWQPPGKELSETSIIPTANFIDRCTALAGHGHPAAWPPPQWRLGFILSLAGRGHPAGQHIIVTSGIGQTGTEDGKVVEVKAGDAPNSAMTHFVVTASREGKNVEWLDFQSRELATIAALAARNTGLTQTQMMDFIAVLKAHVGEAEAESASKLLNEILDTRG